MKNIILATIIMLSFISFASAQKVRFPAIIAAKDSSSMVIFKKCSTFDDCETVGAEEGYALENVDLSPVKDRVKSVGIGVTEGAIGASIGFIPGLMYGLETKSMAVLCGFVGLFSAGGIILPSLITDYLNPAYFWRKGNIKANFFNKKSYEDNKVIVMEFSNAKKMDKHVKALLNVLNKELDEE